MIWLSGPNIFKEYLHQPVKSAEVLQDGWFCTGDLGRVDADGFLYIEGRLTRFSKIGGEMVPHETVEEAVASSLGLASDEDRHFAIVGFPDETKGESLVLLSVLPGLDPTDLRYRLLERGIPSLWIPRQIVKVTEIPHLASGKLDLKRCQDLARPS
jgi:acyl-[acyl-carrier-protein]-phospholipid O-acyltransferase / long-chain-fatty-acid--[acyl-carrier-protein] ligase